MSDRHLLRVSCKCALYTPDGAKVLLSEYEEGDYGLPGGHMDPDEMPDETIARELYEELGLRNLTLSRKDFWMHKNGKLILGYTGSLDETTKMIIQDNELRNALWVEVALIEDGTVNVDSYEEFICKFKPTQ